MNVNSKLATVAVVSAVAGATFFGVNTASAHMDANGESLVSKIAARYEVSEAEVQELVDEVREENQAEREAARDEHLTDLVEDGTITEEQRADLEEFHDEKVEQREELRAQDLTREEKREAMEALRDEVEAWAEAEGIDLEELRGDKDREDRKERRQERRAELRERLDAEFGEPAEQDSAS